MPGMTSAELGAVADRIPTPGSGYKAPGADTPTPTHEQIAAAELGSRIASGDSGAVLRLVHELEYGLGPWEVSPWRVLEHIAARLMSQRRAAPSAVAAAPASEPVPVPPVAIQAGG